MRRIAYIVLCWLITALVVAGAASDTTTQAFVIALAGVLVRTPSFRRAFLIGAAWLALSIAAEIAVTLTLHHGWFALLGSPDEGWRRDVVVMTWLVAPALFVRWPLRASPIGMRSAFQARMFEIGEICRSKDPIMKIGDEEQARICRILGVVPESRWRTPGMPEYKVELLNLPVTAFRRHADLVPVAQADADSATQLAAAG